MRKVLVALIVAYLAAYAVFRQTHVEVWEKDKRAYVMFPLGSPWLYYAFRPISYVDGLATGMRFHIGPHR
jgi:hypothetical protein